MSLLRLLVVLALALAALWYLGIWSFAHELAELLEAFGIEVDDAVTLVWGLR